MTRDDFKLIHSELIMQVQCIENDLRIIYAAMKSGDFEDNFDDLERANLGRITKELKELDNVVIAGDGAKLCCDNIGLDNVTLADEDKIYQNAIGVALASKDKPLITAKELMPTYLRLSQAERELKLKRDNKGE